MTQLLKRCLAFAFATALAPAAASAHGGEPLPTDITAVGESAWVLRTNFGLITSDAPNRYVCEEAFAGGDDFQVAPLGPNEWLLFTRDTVIYSPDGCNFEIRQQIPRKPAGVAVSPSGARAVYLINVDDVAQAGVWWTDDEAATVEQIGLDSASLHLTRAMFVDDTRLLVSAYSSEEANRGQARLIAVNLNDGTTDRLVNSSWLSHSYLLDVNDGWVVWLASDDNGLRIFWGPIDEPTRYSEAVDRWPSGAVLADGGQAVWVSGVIGEGRGVLVGDAGADPVWSETLVDHSAKCVGYIDGTHHLCARRDHEGHDLSRVGTDGSIEGVVNFANLAGPRDDCPADSDVATTCPAVWSELARALDIEVASGTGDAGHVDEDGHSHDNHDHSHDNHDHAHDEHGGCSTGGGGVPMGIWLVIGGVWAIGRKRK